MISKKFFLLCLVATILISCSHKTWTVTEASSIKIPIDNSTEISADKAYEAYLCPIKQEVDAKMNIVIGQAAETMKGHGPESLLSNLNADIYRQAASKFLGQEIDISIVNLGGLRTVVTAGDITIGKVFELMPFENELVILWLKGDKLNELLQYFASMGGEGVSGLHMEIEHCKAIHIKIGDRPLDKDKIYTIATNDYLAGGNDKMVQLAMYEKKQNTGIKIRNMLLDYIKSEMQKGNKIQSKLDGRITINR